MRRRPIATFLSKLSTTLAGLLVGIFAGGCIGPQTTPEAVAPLREPSSIRDVQLLAIDGAPISEARARQLVQGEPVERFHYLSSVAYGGKTLAAYRLRTGEFVYVHSHRYVLSPKATGQPQFDTFLFGCEFLPPSPLDRVVTEGLRMKSGESVLIEEYPDHTVTGPGAEIGLITCGTNGERG